MNDQIDILLTINSEFSQHAGVLLCSLFENNLENRFYIYIVSDFIEEEQKQNLVKLVAKYGHELEFIAINKDIFEKFSVSTHASLANYYRILCSEYLPSNLQKILYLDVDMIVLRNISEIWNTSLDGVYAAVCSDFQDDSKKVSLGISQEQTYFNSGVMLINLEAWRRESIVKKLIEFIQENPHKLEFWDQDALNYVIGDRVSLLKSIWNVKVNDMKSIPKRPNIGILHFTGPSKPWQYMNKHPMKGEYFKYLQMTPWKNYIQPDKTIGNFLRKYRLIK